MRTTVRLEKELMVSVKRYAAETGRTLTSLIEEALRAFIHRGRKRPARSQSIRLTTFKGRGIREGVDLDNTAALLDFMERGDAVP